MIWLKCNKRWFLAMAAALPLFLSACAGKPVLVIPADRMVKSLPNGNYEVTPAWLLDRYETERGIQRMLDECRGKS